MSGLCRVVHAVIVCGGKRLLPAKLSYRLSCVGDALPDNQPVCLLADEGAIVALNLSIHVIFSFFPLFYRKLSLLPTHSRALPTSVDDIRKVTGREELVHKLVVRDQGEHGLVLVDQKAMFDTNITRPGDDHDVRVID